MYNIVKNKANVGCGMTERQEVENKKGGIAADLLVSLLCLYITPIQTQLLVVLLEVNKVLVHLRELNIVSNIPVWGGTLGVQEAEPPIKVAPCRGD